MFVRDFAMIRILCLTCLVVFTQQMIIGGEAGLDKSQWDLVWQDEFNERSLNTKKWTRVERGSSDWKNTMSLKKNLIEMNGEYIRLLGVENPDRSKDKAPYLTAGLSSQGKFSKKYGKVVIRARFKSADGAWPALWMLGDQGKWPGNGEIDLMEHLNFDDQIYQTVHSKFTKRVPKPRKPRNGRMANTKKNKWNTYGCEWGPREIQFTVNGRNTLRYPRIDELGETQWPFDQPFYFLLTMQIGGDWVNSERQTDPDHYPAWMDVDWIRVYQPKSASR